MSYDHASFQPTATCPILLDPIFQGLAVALISGVVVSTALTLVVIPVLYYMYIKAVGKEVVVRG